MAKDEGMVRMRRHHNGKRGAERLCRHDDQGGAARKDFRRFLSQRLYGDGRGGFFRACAARRAVAVPLEWKELKGLKAASQFSIDDVIRRIKKKSPNPERYQVKQRIPGK
jgi:hypothetical protein